MIIDDHTIGFIKASSYRKRILNILHNINMATPTELSTKLEVSLPQVSRTLSELVSQELVRCTTPNRSKGKIYRLTSRGIDVLLKMGEY